MFINCPHCRALVATDPATDLPPEHCPRCVLRLREPVEEDALADVAAASAAPATDTPRGETQQGDGHATADVPLPTPHAAATPAAGPTGAAGPRSDAAAMDAAEAARVADAADAAEATAAPIGSPGHRDAGVAGPASETTFPTASPRATTAGPDANRGDDVDSTARVDTSPDDTPADALADADDAAPEVAAASAAATPRSAHAPSFAARRAPAADPPASRRTRWILPAACAVLALLLGLQWLLADRARLAGEARWRPLVIAACNVFGCNVPEWHEPSALVLVSRDVRPHPQQPGALRVQAVLRNDARWTQAWPGIVLTLSDVDGRAVASRAFTADEYLPARTSSGLESGQTASIRFDVVEPATPVVAFGFDFR